MLAGSVPVRYLSDSIAKFRSALAPSPDGLFWPSAASASALQLALGRVRRAARSSFASTRTRRGTGRTRAVRSFLDFAEVFGLDWDEGPESAITTVHLQMQRLLTCNKARRVAPEGAGVPLLKSQRGSLLSSEAALKKKDPKAKSGGLRHRAGTGTDKTPPTHVRLRFIAPTAGSAYLCRHKVFGEIVTAGTWRTRTLSSSATTAAVHNFGAVVDDADIPSAPQRSRSRSTRPVSLIYEALGAKVPGLVSPPDDVALNARSSAATAGASRSTATAAIPRKRTTRALRWSAFDDHLRASSSSTRSRGRTAGAATASSTRRSSSPSTTEHLASAGIGRTTIRRPHRLRLFLKAAEPAPSRTAVKRALYTVAIAPVTFGRRRTCLTTFPRGPRVRRQARQGSFVKGQPPRLSRPARCAHASAHGTEARTGGRQTRPRGSRPPDRTSLSPPASAHRVAGDPASSR